jgi:hypothetical protein
MKGRLEPDLVSEIESHCESCDECRGQLDFFRKMAAIADLNSAEPPEAWTVEAAGRFQPAPPGGESKVYGDLLFDSCLDDREAVRSKRMETRHLVFDFPRFELDIAMEYAGRELRMLMGHILLKTPHHLASPGNFRLELTVDEHVHSAAPNKLGEFLFKVEAPLTRDPLELRCTSEEGQCAVVLIPC